ncbi:uncharacterized protein [Eurosta solidaginis]|uniref:uncharacterized protein n=1 Tax=Eurosta solidaginis TaxID=178769 RepID=UPI003530C85E
MQINEEQLIILISNYPELYNLQNEHYMNTTRKNNIWAEISKEIGADETLCKEKWKSLGDSYSRNIKKRKTRSGDGASACKRWKYERQMEFLRPYIQERQTKTNFQRSESAYESFNEEFLQDDDTISLPRTSSSTTRTSTPSAKKRTHQSQPSVASVLQNFLTSRQTEVPQSTATGSPIHSFFKAMADSVSVLPLDLQLKAKNKVFSIVSEVEEEHLERSSRSTQQVYDHRSRNSADVHIQQVEERYIEHLEDPYSEYIEDDPRVHVQEDPQVCYVVAPGGYLVPQRNT